MRSCIYCGKELEKGEKCSCPGAVNARQAKEKSEGNTNKENASSSTWQNGTYQTGYTKKQKKSFKDRFSFNKKFNGFKNKNFKNEANGVKGFTKRFIHDPINTVSAPGYLSKFQVFLIILLVSIISSLVAFFITTRIGLGLFGIITEQKYHIKTLLQFAGYGTFTGLILIYLYLLVLWLINKFIVRRSISFSDLAVRPASAMIPILIFGVLGIAVNFFSIYATIMLFLTGIIMSIIMTYEALRAEWSDMSSTKTMYAIALSFFVFFVVVFNVLRLLVY